MRPEENLHPGAGEQRSKGLSQWYDLVYVCTKLVYMWTVDAFWAGIAAVLGIKITCTADSVAESCTRLYGILSQVQTTFSGYLKGNAT